METSIYLVALVVVRQKLRHPINLCKDFNKQLGLVCRRKKRVCLVKKKKKK